MPNLLISGPAGAGKTQEARRMLQESTAPMVAADFQAILVALTLAERDPETGRYPQRLESQASWLLPMVEAIRQTVISLSQERQLDVVATNSDGDAARRAFLLSRLGTGARERVIDPGIDVVHRRLSIAGQLSRQCQDAAGRWYERL